MSARGCWMSVGDSNIEKASVGAGFHACQRLPIFDIRIRPSDTKREIRYRGRAWQPSPTRRIRRLISTYDDGSHQNSKASRILVRADTAVRPYAEDLSIGANSAVVRWQFKYCKRPSCPWVPIMEARIRTSTSKYQNRHRGRAWQPSPTQNSLDHDGANIENPDLCDSFHPPGVPLTNSA